MGRQKVTTLKLQHFYIKQVLALCKYVSIVCTSTTFKTHVEHLWRKVKDTQPIPPP